MLDHVQRRRVPVGPSGPEIALLDWGGEGPLAFLHHANGFCAALWDAVACDLRRDFRVVAMDARGHGDSDKPEGAKAYEWENFATDLAAVASQVAAELSDGRVALGMGHSFGGTSTLAAAAANPGLFERVVCVDPVIMPPPDRIPQERREHGSRLVERTKRRRRTWPSFAEAREQLASRELFGNWTARALDLYVEEGMRRDADGSVTLKCPPEVEAAVFAGGTQFNLFERVSELETPSLLLWANRNSFPRVLVEELVGRMRKGRIQEMDAGHLVTMEEPELVTKAVRAYFSTG